MVKESGDPHLYPRTFQREQGQPKEMQFINVNQEMWSKWKILADDPNKVGVSIVELIGTDQRDLQLGEIDARSSLGSIASQKCQELVLDTLGVVPKLERNPLVDFQLIDYERRNNLRPRDPTYKGFSYGEPTFVQEEYLELYTKGADRRAARDNLIRSADAPYEMLLDHRQKKVDVSVQSCQSVATVSGQQTDKLV